MERRVTKRAVWGSRVEEGVDGYKESCRLHAKDPLAEVV